MNKNKATKLLYKIVHYIKWILLFSIRGYLHKYIGKYINSNSRKLSKLKNSTDKSRCFIVATGPSLTKEDVELLKDEVTFGVNGIFLMYDKSDWRPDYYVFTDSNHFEDMVKEYSLTVDNIAKNKVFLNEKSKKIHDIIKANENTLYLTFSQWNRRYDFFNYRYSDDLVKGVYAFGTVTNISICIAAYMGFKEIYLIGADCSNLNQHFINDASDSHKSDEIAKKIADIQFIGYENMRKEMDKRNIKVFNVTRGGALEAFERKKLEEVLITKNKGEN